ncbi:hypothetical protein AB0D66_31780 [Streptomyces sp. NPDC048270]|uniref:hypothetical protein n=1 Tax=Streptomyces sp. NPDC048270 TaxID=3154615 RepID=UPI0033C46709
MHYGTDPPNELMIIDAFIPRPPARVLLLRGTVGYWDEETLDSAFAEATAAGLPLIVDLGALESADAILLGLLLSARRRVSLHLVGPLSCCFARRLLITGTRQVLRVHENLTDALAAITVESPTGNRPGPPLPPGPP